MNFSLSIIDIHNRYRSGDLTPNELLLTLRQKIIADDDYKAWIHVLSEEELSSYTEALATRSIDDLPLFGIPFAIKDNIDLAGVPTTAACPEFCHQPEKSAFIVQRLISAGAVPLGKTNMDQFATGLVGTRSPYGETKNAFDKAYISGGSSSGSAVAIARGHVSFALGTDTAGSGRVPAMLNRLYGLKPTRGLLSMSGVLPACRSLDCPSIFSLTAADAATVFNVAAEFDPEDSYSRKNNFMNGSRYTGPNAECPTVAVPLAENLEFYGDESAETQFREAVEAWRLVGAKIVEVDIEPLLSAARLLYQGPWVAERHIALENMLSTKPEAIHPVVKGIVEGANQFSATDTFKAEYQMQHYRQSAQSLLRDVDFLLTPTAPRTYKIEELLGDPVRLNSHMGYYTNYMNLLDLCGIAIPAGKLANRQQFGVTLVAPAFSDQRLLGYARQMQHRQKDGNLCGAVDSPATLADSAPVNFSETIPVVVCGAHLSGMPLNWQLTERGARLLKKATTAASYRFYALGGGPPFRPGLIRDDQAGSAIEVEVWSLPVAEFGSFVGGIPAPLGIGKLELDDGSWEAGFICEPYAIDNAEEITELGCWRVFMAQKSAD